MERVVRVGVWTAGWAGCGEKSIAELKLLAETAGSVVLDALIPRRQKTEPAKYIGTGKVEELSSVVESTGAYAVIYALIQRRQKPDLATYIGTGKVAELRAAVESTGADSVICDGALAPSQLRNLEDWVKVKVVDRTALILDIFAQHAKSKE